MDERHRSTRPSWQAAAALLALVVLSACGPRNATPTVSVDAIYTAAYNTMLAQQATQLALTPPTPVATITPLPTLPTPLATSAALPTLAFASPTSGGTFNTGGGSCDSSAFVADVTIPDNTTLDAGKKFTKTWSLLNNGTCTWSTSYSLQFDSGDQMGGSTVAVGGSVAPGSTVNISVPMTAPSTKGTYKGIWRMHNASAQAFGDTPWVVIKVGEGATATSGPSPTAGPATPTARGGFVNITVTANVPDFTVHFSNADSTPDCNTGGGSSCTFSVKEGWSGTISLSKGKWVFSPASKALTNVTSSRTINFTAESPTSTP